MRTPLLLSPTGPLTPGGTATIRLPGPRCYHSVLVQCSSLLFSEIDFIRVLGNSRVIQEFTGEALDVFNKFDGYQAADDTYFRVNFDQTGLKERRDEEITSFNVGSLGKDGAYLKDLEIQVGINSAATNPKIVRSTAIVSPKKEGGPGAIRSVYRKPGIPGSAGKWVIDSLPHGTRQTEFLSRLFIKAANINSVEIKRDGVTNWEREAGENTFELGDAERNPQAGWFIIDFSENGYGENKLDVREVKDVVLNIDSSAAETVEVFAEYIGKLEI